MTFGIVELYHGASGENGFYNSQEIGIARAMKRRGYNCVVFYPDITAKKVKEERIEENILVVYCPANAIGVHSSYDWKVLLRYLVDVIQIGSDNQLYLPSLVRFCRKNNIRFYNYIGTVGSDSSNRLKKIILNLLFRRNLNIYRHNKCFVKTEAVYKALCARGIKDITIMPVGLDLAVIPEINESKPQLRAVCNIPQEKKVVIFVGRMDGYKRPLELVKLIDALPEQYYFIIIGTGFLDDEVEHSLEKLDCSERIKRIKKIPNSKIHRYYALSDYYVNFNDKEIFGMSILEAMYHGCTVVANHAPGPDMIIENGESGWLAQNTEEIIDIIEKEETVNTCTIKSRILDVFVWDKTVEKICKWIETFSKG